MSDGGGGGGGGILGELDAVLGDFDELGELLGSAKKQTRDNE